MTSRVKKVALAVVIVVAASAGAFVATSGSPAALKLRGKGADCPWPKVLSMEEDQAQIAALKDQVTATLEVGAQEDALDIEQVTGAARPFWIVRSGEILKGKDLLGYLLADHSLLSKAGAELVVKPGDVVLDCGGHVGVFTHTALALGAAKVVAAEPDPVNAECYRRNFAKEIAEGKVVLVEKGVWDKPGKMKLQRGKQNSGSSSLVLDEGGSTVEVELTTVDAMLAELGVPCVSYVKLDIEGAEREALAGAAKTLERCKPRLMIDAYHLDDDPVVLPRLLRKANPAYQFTAASCEEFTPGSLTPHVVYVH